jgi:hypothetical protein
MSTDTCQKYRDAFVALFAPDMNATATALVSAVLNQEVVYNCTQPLDASINTATTHTLEQSSLVQMKVNTFKVVTHANITAVNTNVAQFSLVYNNGNGGADTIVCANITTATTAGSGTGDITALVAYAFTVNASNALIPAGSQVQVKVIKSGTGGCTLPMLSFTVKGTAV